MDLGGYKYCITLKRLSLPSQINLRPVDGRYFSGCKSLESISIVGSNRPDNYPLNGRAYDMDGVLFFQIGYEVELVKFPANKGSEYTIPEYTKKIRDCAFEDSHLTRLTMPSVPPTCPWCGDPFKGVDIASLTLVIPKGSHDSYWTHPVFGKFNLEEMDE